MPFERDAWIQGRVALELVIIHRLREENGKDVDLKAKGC